MSEAQPSHVRASCAWAALRRRVPAVLALAAVAWLLFAHSITFAYTADDAFISYRYAQNFLAGHGLVWNIGQPPVEGYSNPLYVFVLCLGGRLGFDINAFSIWINFICAFAAAGFCFALTLRMAGGRSLLLLAAFAPLLLAQNENFAIWVHGGLETVPYAMLLAALAWLGSGWPRISRAHLMSLSFLFALATLLRMDAALLFVGWWAATALYLLIAGRLKPWKERTLDLLSAGLPFTLLVGAHLLWRHAYYGEWLPNTFYAKIGEGAGGARRGAHYVLDYLRAFEWSIMPLLMLAALALLRRRAVMTIYLWAASLAIVVCVGGDLLMAWRFIVPLMPLAYALLTAGLMRGARKLAGDAPRLRTEFAVAAAVLLGICGLHLTTPGWRTGCGYNMQYGLGRVLRGEWPCVGEHDPDNLRKAGQALRGLLPPDYAVACHGVGRIAYYSQRPVLDLLGLNDRHIARLPVPPDSTDGVGHQKYDPQYVIEQRPEIYLPGWKLALDAPLPTKIAKAEDWRDVGLLPCDWALLRDPAFMNAYEPEMLSIGDNLYVPLLRRRDLPPLTAHLPGPAQAPAQDQ